MNINIVRQYQKKKNSNNYINLKLFDCSSCNQQVDTGQQVVDRSDY